MGGRGGWTRGLLVLPLLLHLVPMAVWRYKVLLMVIAMVMLLMLLPRWLLLVVMIVIVVLVEVTVGQAHFLQLLMRADVIHSIVVMM